MKAESKEWLAWEQWQQSIRTKYIRQLREFSTHEKAVDIMRAKIRMSELAYKEAVAHRTEVLKYICSVEGQDGMLDSNGKPYPKPPYPECEESLEVVGYNLRLAGGCLVQAYTEHLKAEACVEFIEEDRW